jgi:hypothetical protein
MPIRKSFTYKDIVAILIHEKCSVFREGRGSHEIWYSGTTKKTFAVPRH